MDHNRDEHIVCLSCGNSFLFSASEAAHYAERGLSAPPKRCKECRRARKEQRGEGQGGVQVGLTGRYSERRSGGSSGPRDGNVRARMPAHTGDVNEYRSPMQTGYQPPTAASWRGGAGGNVANGGMDQGRRRGPRPAGFANDGNYRSPSFGGEPRDAPRAPAGRGRGRPQGEAPARPAAERTREMFSITCKSCGAEGQVPFKPDEGRDVFCQACYRAKKPA